MINSRFTLVASAACVAILLSACGSSGRSFNLAGGAGPGGGGGGGGLNPGGGTTSGANDPGTGSGGTTPGATDPGAGTPGGTPPGGTNPGGGLPSPTFALAQPIGTAGNVTGGALYTAGTALLRAGGTTSGLTGRVNGILPVTAPVTGTVNGLVNAVGGTLAGAGGTLRTDGLGAVVGSTPVVGPVLNNVAHVAVLDGAVGSSGTPLLGLGLLAPNQATGSLATIGGGTGGALLDVQIPAGLGPQTLNSTVSQLGSALGPVPGATPVTGVVGGVVGAATNVVSGLTGAVGGLGLNGLSLGR